MIRIKPRRCGYGGEKGYTCQRLPQLQDWMFNEEIPFIAQMKAEFNKLPLRVKGMVYTEETIDMGWSEFGPHPEVPELTCRSNTDPASDATDVSVWGATGIPVEAGNATAYPVYGGSSGWLDLFNSGYEITGGTQYFYHNVSETAAATSDVYIKVTGVDHEYHDIYLVGNIPTFKNGEQEMEMGPGLLEPMLDTDFAPVGIDTIPAWEAGLDADIFTNIVLNAWKGVIDDRIQNIYARLNTLPAYDTDQKLRDLTAAENKDSECDNFQIALESGSPVRDPDDVDAGKYHAATLPNADNTSTPITVGSKWHSRTVTAVWQDAENIWWWTVEDDPNQYTISGGDIAYGDNTISVVGLSGLYAPFYAYLMPSFDVTITHTDVVAADVPTVVDGGTARMITDGDVLPSGGTVTGFTSSGSGTATRYAWETVGDNTAEIRTKTGPQLSEEGTADPEPGGIGIGGVRIIQSAAESDPLILYKIYHEDCIAGIEKPEAAADAATAGWLRLSPVFPYEEELMNVEIPSGTEGVDPTVIGATAGIVQPVHNIQIHGSTEYRTQSPVDVPTVEAVYNFIHNYDDFADGEFEQASALATGSTMYTDGSSVAIYTKEVSGYTGSLAVPGTAIVATDIKTILVEGRTVTASGCVPTAQAVVDYIGELTFDGVGSTVGIIDYTTNVPETLWPIPGSTVDPAAGYVQNVRNIYVAGTHSVSGYAVPTVDAVYNFIHNIAVEGMTFSSALVTGGTLAEITTTAEDVTTVTGYTATGEPGTCYMTTVIPVGSTVSIGLDNCAPTVQAVIDYVGAMDVDAVAGTLINGSTTEEWAVGPSYTDPVRGTVEVSSQIVVGSTPGLSLQTVPSVKSVYDFIHNDSTDTAYQALATPGVMGSTANAQSVYGTTVTGATPGTYNVVKSIVTIQNGTVSTLGGTTAQHYVPEAQAVVDWTTAFVAGYTATGGTISIDDTDGEKWVDASTVFTGIVTVSDNVEVAADKDDRNLSPYAVPTVEAVYLYVEERVPGDAQEGYIKVASGKESLDFITGYTEAYAGLVQPVVNISAGTESPNAVSPTAVPTVQAVIDYIHGTSVSGYTTADSRATATITELVSGSTTTVQLKTGATRGTFFVTSDMQAISDTVTVYNDPQAVPTTMAVVDYMRSYVARQTAVAGVITVTGTGSAQKENLEPAVTGTTAKAGLVQYVRNILVGGTHGISSYTVPTVEAVDCYIHGKTINGMVFSSARATPGSMDVVTGQTVNLVNSTPGTFDVVNEIETTSVEGSTVLITAANCVPTAEAVVAYVKKAEAGVDDAVTNVITQEVDYGTVSEVSGVPGIVDIYDNIFFVTNGNVTSIYGGTAGVPTLTAVDRYVHGIYARASIGGTTATVEGATAYDCTPGTFDVVSNIEASTVSGVVTSANDVVPTADAVVKYIQNLNLDPAGIAVSGELVDGTGDWTAVSASTVSAGIYYVAINVVGGTAGSDAYSAVPTVQAVNDFVAGYTASVGGFSVTAADKEDWETTGTPATKREAEPGIVGVVDTLVAASTVGNRTLSVKTVPTVAAVKDYVDTHVPDTAVSGNLNQAGDWVNAATVSAGIYWVATNVVGGTAGSAAYSSVPTVSAVHDFVTGHTATAGTFIAPTSSEETWSTASVAGIVSVADSVARSATEAYRVISTKAVPTVEAVWNFVHTPQTTTAYRALSLARSIIAPVQGSTIATLAEGAVPGTVYVTNNMLGLYGENTTLKTTEYVVDGETTTVVCLVPTAQAVKSYVDQYTMTGATAGVLFLNTTKSQDDLEGGVQGIVYTASTICVAGGTSRYASLYTVPTAAAVWDFIHSPVYDDLTYQAMAVAAGTTVTAVGSTIAAINGGTPGTFYVTDDMDVLGTTVLQYKDPQAVPTAMAVARYVALRGGGKGGYDGPFRINDDGTVEGGDVYFAGSLIKTAAKRTTALTNGQTAWLVVTKTGATSYTAVINTSPTNTATAVSYPLAKNVNGTMTQLHYGVVNITGRWM